MRTNRREFAFKKETTPGTAIALASSDVLVRIRSGDSAEPDYEQIDTQEVQSVSSQRPFLIGRRTIAFPVSYLLRGSGAVGTVPSPFPMLESAMLIQETLKKYAIGAITGTPTTFQDGDTVTGLNSSATARVFRDTANGATHVQLVPLSGTLQSGEILREGSPGGTQCTLGDAGVADGYLLKPTDSDFVGGSDSKHHGTAALLQDGYMWRARGCLSEAVFNFRNGHPCIVNQRFMGAYSSAEDEALFNVTSYPQEVNKAPRFLNAGLFIDSYQPTDVIDFTLNVSTSPEPREDANDAAADGVKFADYQRAAPTITLDPAMVKAATYDFFTKLFDGTTFAMKWKLGNVAGGTYEFFADEAQFIRCGIGDRRSLATIPLEIRLNGKNNNDFYIWFH